MFKYRVIAFIVLTAFFISGQAYCQQQIKDQQIKIISGNVTYVEPEAGIVNVQTDDGVHVFYILVESVLYRKTKPMASIEIVKGDPVMIEYNTSYGKNDIIKLVDSKQATY